MKFGAIDWNIREHQYDLAALRQG